MLLSGPFVPFSVRSIILSVTLVSVVSVSSFPHVGRGVGQPRFQGKGLLNLSQRYVTPARPLPLTGNSGHIFDERLFLARCADPFTPSSGSTTPHQAWFFTSSIHQVRAIRLSATKSRFRFRMSLYMLFVFLLLNYIFQ